MKSTVTKIGTIAFAAGMLVGVSAIAQTMSYSDYQAGKTKIKADYKTEKKGCAMLAGNSKDICEEQAEGMEDVAKAELYERYKPSLQSHFKVQVAKAEAIYEVAKERCDDLDGNAEDVCEKEAQAALTAAKAKATVEMKTQAAINTANAKSAAAQSQANSQTAELRRDASADQRAAQYKVEKEKCDDFASTAKDNCLRVAQAQFGKL